MKLGRLFTWALSLLTILALSYGADSLGVGGGGSVSNPYYLYPTQNQVVGTEPFLDLAGKTQVSCALIAERTAVFVIIGQSLNVNSVAGTYSATHAKTQTYNIYNGGCYSASQPVPGTNINGGLTGTNVGFWPMQLADKLITDNKYDRVILVPMAVGGTLVAQWASSTTAPYLANRFASVGNRLISSGLTCTAMLWGQGESDNAASTSQAAYAASLATVITTARAAMPCPFFVAEESWFGGVTSANVQNAQIASWNGTTILQGPNMDSIGAGSRYDNTHLNATGGTTAAGIWETAIITGLGL